MAWRSRHNWVSVEGMVATMTQERFPRDDHGSSSADQKPPAIAIGAHAGFLSKQDSSPLRFLAGA